jgi:hypothetical protein
MAEPLNNRQQQITLESNYLKFNGKTLVPKDFSSVRFNTETDYEIEAHDLIYILGVGRSAINSGIENFYERTKATHPDLTIVRPSLFAVRLGYDETRILTSRGQANNTSIHRSIEEVERDVLPYWHAVRHAGFVPELRSRIGGKAAEATWLLLRKPEPKAD